METILSQSGVLRLEVFTVRRMPIGAFSVATAISLLVAVARRSIFFAKRILSRLFGTLLFSRSFSGSRTSGSLSSAFHLLC